MFDKLPVSKSQLLIAGAVVLLLLSYQLAFKNTITAWQTNSQLKKQLVQATDLSYQPDYLQRKNNNLNKAIELYQVDSNAFRNNSISKIAIIAEKEDVKLSEVPLQDPFFHTAHLIIQKFELEGSYFSLMKTINNSQQTEGIGIIRSVAFKTVHGKLNVIENKKLVAEVYLEIAK